MACNFQAFLDAFKLYHLILISTLAGYLLAAPASLRLWIATQKVPSIPLQQSEPITWKKKALGFGILILLFLAVEYALFFNASEQVLNGALNTLFGFTFFNGSVTLFGDVSGLKSWSVHRNAQGVPIIIPLKQMRDKTQKAALMGGLCAAVAITAGAFATNELALIAVISTAVIYNMTSRVASKTVSMRWMIIGLLGWIAGCILLAVALSLLIMLKGRSGNSDPNASGQKPTVYFSPQYSAWVDEKSWVFPPLYAPLPGMFIALCLRFDYQKHLDDSTATAAEFVLYKSILGAKEGKTLQLGEGVVVPSRAPNAFPKVYYATALVAWGLTQLGLIYVDASTSISFDSIHEFSIVALILEMPIMSLALLAVATVRGEWTALWRYREVWTVEPEAQDPILPGAAPLIPVEKEKTADQEHTVEL